MKWIIHKKNKINDNKWKYEGKSNLLEGKKEKKPKHVEKAKMNDGDWEAKDAI